MSWRKKCREERREVRRWNQRHAVLFAFAAPGGGPNCTHRSRPHRRSTRRMRAPSVAVGSSSAPVATSAATSSSRLPRPLAGGARPRSSA